MSESAPIESLIEVGTDELLGTVVAVQANFYMVRLDKVLLSYQFVLCTRRTRLKKIGQKVMVGDRVLVEELDLQDGRGAIAQVFPRKTQLQRPPVANADQILLLFALEEPTLDPWQLSRFLIEAESCGLGLYLCLNKLDLITLEQQKHWQERLKGWGYDPVFISVETGQGLEKLNEIMRDKITILCGPSGVGKSSLINLLIPQVNQRVATVSGKLLKGRHTTRHVELFELPNRGLLADTPGFNQPELDCEPVELALYFPEARERLKMGNCQFNNCIHLHEPDCIVRGDWERYEYYLKFVEEALARQEALKHTKDEESSLKLKIKGSGEQKYEPKLESKKYRRQGRRQKHQNLHGQYENIRLQDIEIYENKDDF